MKDFPLIKFAISFIVGILLFPMIEISLYSVLVFIVTIVALTVFLIQKKIFEKVRFIYSLVILVLISCFGNLAAQVNRIDFNPVIEKLYKEKNVLISGMIKKIELPRDFEIVFIVKADSFTCNKTTIIDQMEFLCKLRSDKDELNKFYNSIQPGYIIELKGRYSKGRGKRNPGEFDYNNYLKSVGITGIITIDSLSDINLVDNKTNLLTNTVFQIRKYIDKQIRTYHTQKTAALLRGLILADRKEIDTDTKVQFINSGVIHVLAVSGLHVGFIALIFLVLLGRFNIYVRSVITIIGLIFFMFLTGIPSSVFRATIMAVVIIVAYLTNRSTNIFNSLSLGALIILIINPSEIYFPGFQLSFSAVLSIGIIYPIISKAVYRFKIKSKAIKYLLLFVSVSIAAQIGTLPFTLIYFGKLSLIAPIANLIVIPAIGLIIALAVTTLSISWLLPSIASIYAVTTDFITNVIFSVIHFIGELDFSYTSIHNFSVFDTIIFYLFITLLIYFVQQFKNKFAISLLLILTFSDIFIFAKLDNEKLLPENQLSVMMIDVGQGDAFLMKFPDNKTALIDAGEATFYFDNGERVILPLLDYLGIDKIDYGFVSHIDLDHYGGFISLITNDKIKKVFKPSLDSSLQKDIRFEDFLKLKNIPFRYYNSQILKLGNYRLYFLSNIETNTHYNLSSNDKSGILKLVYGKCSFLFTGDAESRIEKVLVEDYKTFLDVDVLKIGHHGSKSGSSDEFIDATSPGIGLISAGINNKFGHPDQLVLTKLINRNVRLLRTDELGAVILSTDGKKLDIIDWR